MARQKTARCSHGHGRSLCFECFRAGSERTKARQEAWAQRTLPFDEAGRPPALSERQITHRRRMLAYLEESARRRA